VRAKVPILDIRARDDPGRQFLVEMQRLVTGGFGKRLLYYWASASWRAVVKGERYEMLQSDPTSSALSMRRYSRVVSITIASTFTTPNTRHC